MKLFEMPEVTVVAVVSEAVANTTDWVSIPED